MPMQQAKIAGAANKVALRALAADIAKANGGLLASQVNELTKMYDAKLKDATVEVRISVRMLTISCGDCGPFVQAVRSSD